MSALRVDGATHVWGGGEVQYPWAPHNGVSVPRNPAKVESLIRALDESELHAAVCVQPRVYGYDHAYLANALRQHPERLAAICLVNPVRHTAPRELENLIIAGFAGVRLIPLACDDASWLVSNESDPLCDAATALKVPIKVLARADQLGLVAGRAGRSSSATIVVDHLGLVDPAEPYAALQGLSECAQHENVTIMVSALGQLSHQVWPYHDVLNIVAPVLDLFGPERVVFGTDWPYCMESGPYVGDRRALTEGLELDLANNAGLFGENASRLWRLAAGN